MNNECFLNYDNHVYAIQNWFLRKSEFDVVILDPLDTQDMGEYEKFSEQGLSDEQIYKKLYPSVEYKPKEKVLIDIDLLTKDQLTQLINVRLKTTLPTLVYMSTDDLKALYSVLDTSFSIRH